MLETTPTLAASEIANLTGVSPTQQRDWRRHGFIMATGSGWARYSISEACRFLLFRLFASQGIGPSSSRPAVDALTTGLSARVVAALLDEAPQADGDQVAVIWATGELETYASVQSAFSFATEAQQAGPCVVLDLNTIATPFAIKVRDYLLHRAGEGEGEQVVE